MRSSLYKKTSICVKTYITPLYGSPYRKNVPYIGYSRFQCIWPNIPNIKMKSTVNTSISWVIVIHWFVISAILHLIDRDLLLGHVQPLMYIQPNILKRNIINSSDNASISWVIVIHWFVISAIMHLIVFWNVLGKAYTTHVYLVEYTKHQH